jgi:glycosyltransferase involved in cell wall biosynthesis
MDSVDISVIIPTYHREQQLLEAVNSVRVQQNVALEVIVVDDSADASARQVIESVNDPRVRYITRPEPSRGRPALVRNDGAKLANGRYLYFLDDDDISEPGALAAMSQALDAAPAAGMVFGVITPFGLDAEVLRHNQQYFAEARRIALKLKGRRQLSAYLTFRAAVLVCSAGMARRTAFTAVGGFDADIPVCEDAELWARIARASGYVFIDKTVVRYRTGAPSLMHNLVENDEKLRVSSRKIQDKYRKANGVLEFFAMKLWARAIFS